MTEPLNDAERDLIRWLSEEEFNQYGECYGAALDSLIAKGLAQVHPDIEKQAGFIAKGKCLMYYAVSLTNEGRALVHDLRQQQ